MRRALAFMERDVRRLLRNPMTVGSAVLLPLVYLFVLGNSLLGPIHGLRLGVVLEDRGSSARDLLGALHAIEQGPRTVALVPIASAEHAMQMLRDGDISGFVRVPERFSADLEREAPAPVGLYVDNVDAVAARTLESAVASALPAIGRPLARLEMKRSGVELRTHEIYPRVDYDTSLVPAVVVMAMFMGSMIAGGFSLVMDRFLGVHESYLATPLTRTDIAVGMLGSGTFITLMASFTVLLFGLLATGGHVGGGVLGGLTLAATMILTTFGLLAMMMVVIGRASHPRVAGVVNGFLNVLLFFPSGALYPVESFPRWLRAFAQVNPEMHAVAALKAVLFREGDVTAALPHVLFLGGFAIVMMVIAAATLKRTL